MNLTDYLEIGFVGACRSIAVNSIVYPIESIKVQSQVHGLNESTSAIALRTLKNDGLQHFYRGFYYQSTRSIFRQFYIWPLIIQGPNYLENCETTKQFNSSTHQFIVGSSIAMLDSLATPIEAKRVQAIQATGTHEYSKTKGFFTQFLKSSVGFNSFLVSQDFFRSYFKKQLKKEELSLHETMIAGSCVAVVVALTTSPVDRATNRILANQKGSMLSLKNTSRDFRMNFLILVIQNMASVSLIEYLSRSYTSQYY